MRRVVVRSELLAINLCSLLLILVITVVDLTALRVVLGLPFTLFFPGYALAAALFPRRGDLGWKERSALSVGLSVILTPVTGLLLTHLGGIRLYPVLVSLTVVIALLSAVAWLRRWRCPEQERLVLDFGTLRGGGRPHNVLDWTASIALGLGVIGAVGVMAWAFASPGAGERFTEFYMLDAGSGPWETVVGDNSTVTLGIVNREGRGMQYTVEALVGGWPVTTVGPVWVDRDGTWESAVRLAPVEASVRTRLTEEVTASAAGMADDVAVGSRYLRVVTTAGLESGDHLMVGPEAAVVQTVDGDTVILSEGLKQYHAAGSEVVEVQKAEFRLFKTQRISEGGTSLALWVGKERLVATVRNVGEEQASYWVRVLISGGQGEAPVTRSVVGPASQAAGDVWTADIDYPFSELNEIQVELYQGDGLLYVTSESEPYPSLHLWMVVS